MLPRIFLRNIGPMWCIWRFKFFSVDGEVRKIQNFGETLTFENNRFSSLTAASGRVALSRETPQAAVSDDRRPCSQASQTFTKPCKFYGGSIYRWVQTLWRPEKDNPCEIATRFPTVRTLKSQSTRFRSTIQLTEKNWQELSDKTEHSINNCNFSFFFFSWLLYLIAFSVERVI